MKKQVLVKNMYFQLHIYMYRNENCALRMNSKQYTIHTIWLNYKIYYQYLLFMLTLEEQDKDEMLDLLASNSTELTQLELSELNKLKLLEQLKLWLLEQLQNETLELLDIDMLEQLRLVPLETEPGV